MNEIECPYCEHLQEVNHDDGYGYEEDILYHQQCEKCDKHFSYNTIILYTYESFKGDCLNDGKHNYEPTTTYPKYASKMICLSCGDKRNPTFEERKKYDLLPTDDDLEIMPHLNIYFKN